MNHDEEAMRMAIMAKALEKEIFKNSDKVTITKEYFRETLIPIYAKRVTLLIVDALMLVKDGIAPMTATSLLFLKERLLDVIGEQDCENCPAKEKCDKEKLDDLKICKN